MNKKKIYLHALNDIFEGATKAMEFVGELSLNEFIVDDKTNFAVVRALEVIGEATKNIPEEIRIKYPQIPWRAMAGMRDKLIHHYFGVNLETVWKTVTEDLPDLQKKLEEILIIES